MRGQYKVRNDVDRRRNLDRDVPDVAPVGVEQGGGPHVVLAGGAVRVPGLGARLDLDTGQDGHCSCPAHHDVLLCSSSVHRNVL